MASVGVNGAAAATLNERFIKCAGCKVNIPKEDMLALGKCTVCGRVYAPEDRGDVVVVETVAFASDGAKRSAAVVATGATGEKPTRKRWMELKSKRGRTYYHNTETGEDTWEKPVDIDADAVDNDGFVPFKNDAVKNAVLREQAKMDATKMGLPAEVIATLQQQQLQQEEQDPFNSMLKRPAQNAKTVAAQPTEIEHPPRAPSRTYHQEGVEEEEVESEEEDRHEEGRNQHSDASDKQSQAKQGSCAVM